MSSVVYQELANSFTHGNQKILERDIAAIIYGPRPAPDSGVVPARAGEIYVQIPEGAEDHKLHAWVSVAKTVSTFDWVPLNVGEPLPANLALRDEPNDFTNLDQTISGDKILSFIRGEGTPPQGVAAKYDGQLYISFKTLESGPDVAIWAANGNTWVPIVKEAVDVSKFAKLDTSNVFENTVQMLGPAEDGRLLNGTRIKRAGNPPAFDAGWLAKVEGETTIYFKPDSNPQEISIWTAISATGTNPANHWKMTWSSVGGSVDTSNLAKLDVENTFTHRQKIGDDINFAHFISGRKSALDPLDAASPDFLPFVSGDIFVREYLDKGATEYQIFVSTGGGNADSWLCVYDSKISTTALADKITALEVYDDTHDAQITALDVDLGTLGETVTGIGANLTALETDVDLEKGKLTIVEERVGTAELKIIALETHHTNNQLQFATHDDRISTAELDIDKLLIDVGNSGETLNTLVADMAVVKPLKDEVISLKNTTVRLLGTTNNHTTRIEAAEDNITDLKASDVTINGKIDAHSVSIAAAQEDADDAYNKAVSADSTATFAKNKVVIVEPKVDALETKVTALETATTSFTDLTDTPATLTADKLLITNADGTGVVESSVTASTIKTMSNGLNNGDYKIDMNSLGCGTNYTSASVAAVAVKETPFIFVTPNEAGRTVTMADIVANNATTLSTTQVREGRTTWVCNQETSRSITLNAKRPGNTEAQTFFINKADHNTLTLEAGKTIILQPTVFSNNTRKWVAVAKFSSGL